MKHNLKRIWDAFTTVLVASVVFLALFLFGLRLYGLPVYSVLSGSMEPAIQTGSIIYVKEIDAEEIIPGDVITFYLTDEITATHRVVEVIKDDSNSSDIYFKTKGDANQIADKELVNGKDVIGKVFFTIPYLGYVSQFLQSSPIILPGMILAMILLSISLIQEILSNRRKGKGIPYLLEG